MRAMPIVAMEPPLTWKGIVGARNYEVQYSLDLSGATGWTTVAETLGKGRINVDDLTSGTKFAFRVRGFSKAYPGPRSGPVQQWLPETANSAGDLEVRRAQG